MSEQSSATDKEPARGKRKVADAAPETRSTAPPDRGAPAAAPPPLTAEQRAQMEKLSMNLARAAMTAQGAIAEMALKSADRPAALSPDPFHVAPALSEVMGRLAGQPDKLMRAQ